MNGMTTYIYFDLKDKDNDTITDEIDNSDLVSPDHRVSQRNRTPPYEALFGGKPRIGHASMNLG